MSLWWKSKKSDIQNIMNHKILEFVENVSAFPDTFLPDFKEKMLMPQKQPNHNSFVSKDSSAAIYEAFDTAYYFFLWDKFTLEYGMNELDSLSLDSLIKIEMKKRPVVQNDNNEQTHDNRYSIKKDELLFVMALKPIPLKPEIFREQDSLDFALVENTLYTIEFWKSPLNFQGIKTTGNIITVYGITDFEQVSVVYIAKNTLALRLKNKLFTLKNDGVFYNFRELSYNNL